MKKSFGLIVLLLIMTSCNSWESKLSEKMPYLGHRNWIVIADMAYPLQSGDGILTLYADEPYASVLQKVKDMVDAQPHVFAHIYNDAELEFVPEEDAPGVEAFRRDLEKVCGAESVRMRHEDLIRRLAEAGKLYQVIIIKTPMTIPYTTTFFELDCGYWDAEKQERLDSAMSER